MIQRDGLMLIKEKNKKILGLHDKDHFVARFRIRAEQVLREQQQDC